MRFASFSEEVLSTAERYGMDLRRPLALVSGGPDSVALLRVILALGGEPVALHVDHGLRGEQSREDAEFVRDLCRQLGVRTVATGHTADDVVETVLMNLARGTGLRGLAGIPPVRGEIQRPLIGRTRREVLNYLRELNQPYRTDPTNLTDKYVRNRIRLEVLPILEELYPAAAGNIARAASLVREDLEILEELATSNVEMRGDEVVLPLDGLMKLRPSLRRHAVRLAYTTVVPDTAALPSNLIEAVLELL